MLKESVKVKLRCADRDSYTVILTYLGMNFTEQTQLMFTLIYIGAAAGVVGLLAGGRHVLNILNAQGAKYCIHIAL